MQGLKTIAIVSLASATLAACANLDQDAPTVSSAPDTTQTPNVASTPVEPAFFVDWTQEPIDSRWYVSNHNTNRGQWESDWRNKNVVALPNGLNLRMTAKSPSAGEWPWAAGEIQYRQRLGFGEYQMIVRAAEGSGLHSGFFTYTGPYYNTEHNEIDVSFVGKSPYEVQLNAFAGDLEAGVMKYPLDFDTTKNFALYSFIWAPDRITWYVNGEFAHEITDENFAIPQTPSILFANVYQARNKNWVGEPEFQDGATASYRCMSYRPLGDTTTRTCADAYDSYVAEE